MYLLPLQQNQWSNQWLQAKQLPHSFQLDGGFKMTHRERMSQRSQICAEFAGTCGNMYSARSLGQAASKETADKVSPQQLLPNCSWHRFFPFFPPAPNIKLWEWSAKLFFQLQLEASTHALNWITVTSRYDTITAEQGEWNKGTDRRSGGQI